MRDAIASAYERIRPYVRETPLELSGVIAPGSGATVLLKLEHLQRTGSFKLRGATNRVERLTPEQAALGVITASNGNHGLGVAAAAKARGIAAEVYVSSHVSPAKARRIEAFGAQIRCAGADPLTAELAARRAANDSGRVFISPYNDLDVMAGQGTVAVEILRQCEKVDAVFVAVGGGGLIGGIGAWMKAESPGTEVVGCWASNSPVLYECIRAGRIIEVPEQPTLSESTAGGLEPESVTLDVCRRVIDRSVLVSEQEILAAMRLLMQTEHWIVEGAAGVALASFLRVAGDYRGKTVAVVLCGRNASDNVMRQLV